MAFPHMLLIYIFTLSSLYTFSTALNRVSRKYLNGYLSINLANGFPGLFPYQDSPFFDSNS